MNKYSSDTLPTNLMTKLAKKHKILRKKKKYSQVEMAKRSGISLGSLKRFERSGEISLKSLLKLAHLHGRLDDFNNIFDYKYPPSNFL